MILCTHVKYEVIKKGQAIYYNRKGFDCKVGDILNIPLVDIPLNSHLNILVQCDNCKHEHKLRYQAYNKITKNNTEPYYCNNKDCINIKRELAVFKKYGCKNVFQLKEVKDKIVETNNELYGVDNPQQNKEIKNKSEETNLKKYGCKNVFQNENIKIKSRETTLKKYGVEHITQSKYFINKIIETNNKKYNCDWPIQNDEHYKKIERVSVKIKKYKNTTISYQASYELDFLDRYYAKFVDIENGKSFKYLYEGKNKKYYSDFYIPSKNLIVEIKNKYLYKRDYLKIKQKEHSVKSAGYNYILILEKNYDEFEKLYIN